jgi:inorganic pyrophosphatase
MQKLSLIAAVAASLGLVACSSSSNDPAPVAGLRYVDANSLTGDVNFWRGIDPGPVGTVVTAVIEIPANTTAKWEMCGPSQVDPANTSKFPECTGTTPGQKIVWEVKSGARRVIKFAGYPGNYGYLPRTMTPDGDPLDVLTVGQTVDRGHTVGAKVIGVLHCLDGGEVDDKIVAIQEDSPFYAVDSLDDTAASAPYAIGLKAYLLAFFESYKGPGAMDCSSIAAGDPENAMTTIANAKAGYTP